MIWTESGSLTIKKSSLTKGKIRVHYIRRYLDPLIAISLGCLTMKLEITNLALKCLLELTNGCC